MTLSNTPAGKPGGAGSAGGGGQLQGSPLRWLPAAWVGIVILLSGWAVYAALPLLGDYEMPESVMPLIYGGLVGGVVTILWGLFLLALTLNRSPAFPRNFVIWQIVQIIWTIGREAYVLLVPAFVFTATNLIYAAVEIAIGVLMIALVNRKPADGVLIPVAAPARTPLAVMLIAIFLGILLGGALGAGAGLLGGSIVAEVTDMSCFEGACGYFAALIGLLGLLAGAIGGGILGGWLAGRRARTTA